jgi:hypothetical protein
MDEDGSVVEWLRRKELTKISCALGGLCAIFYLLRRLRSETLGYGMSASSLLMSIRVSRSWQRRVEAALLLSGSEQELALFT